MLAAYLDSTNLKPDATRKDIYRLAEEAVKYGMAAVCVQPCRLDNARFVLTGSKVKLCTVVGFPLGAEPVQIKKYAAKQALKSGAEELDMMINVGAVKDGDYISPEKEIKGILELRADYDFILKVIVETALLDPGELAIITRVVGECGADYIKTSTGYSSRGASLEDIELIAANKSETLKIKASGGIRELDFALNLIAAGVDRIGSSVAGQLVEEYRSRGGR